MQRNTIGDQHKLKTGELFRPGIGESHPSEILLEEQYFNPEVTQHFTRFIRIKILILTILVIFCLPGFSQILTVEISGIRSDKGIIELSIYRDKETFKAETPYRAVKIPKTAMKEGIITLNIPGLPYGTYGIALFDDENQNAKIDRRLLIPVEGFGFSDFFFKGTCKPDFNAFAFMFSEHKTTVSIKVQYL